ncbi:hypothetical protein [Polaribacter sp.]|jgi:hypothetical protein
MLFMISKAKTIPEYLAIIPEERTVIIEKLRNVITKNLPTGFEEGVQYS